MIGHRVSHYRIVEKIGEGGMGAVYLAEDERLKHTVAIKFLPAGIAENPKSVARFRREAQAVARLKHPNIVVFHEFGEHEGAPFIVMEHVEGTSLSKMLARGPLPIEAAIDIARQILSGLGKAHDAGITHRDIKPDNIIIDNDGRARILDFGVAKYEGATALTAENATLGTVAYMSPEQATGEKVDVRSDLFSVGAVLYELLTGKAPFCAEHISAVVYRIVHEAPPPLPAGVSAYEPVLSRALAKDPSERYQSAREFAHAIGATTGGTAQPNRTSKHVRWKPILGIAALALAAVVVVALFLRLPNDATASRELVAVMYFDNVTDPDDPGKMGTIITNLLITDLSESDGIDVLSEQRLYDILKQNGKEGQKRIDRDTATMVATKAGAHQMVFGSILQTADQTMITSRIVEVQTGEVVGSQKISGGPGDDIFALVDRLTEAIQSDLSVPVTPANVGPALADVTTHSIEAYQQYIRGMEYWQRYEYESAYTSFTHAVELDSTFIIAGYMQHLAARDRAEKQAALERVMKLLDRAGERERHLIQSAAETDLSVALAEIDAVIEMDPTDKLALFRRGELIFRRSDDFETAAETFQAVLHLDPFDRRSLNLLSYAQAYMGDFGAAISAIDRYIQIAPAEWNPIDSGGEILALAGKLDEAIASFETASQMTTVDDPHDHLAITQLHAGLYAQAADYFAARALDPGIGTRAYARLILAFIPLQQGRLRDALRVLEENVAADEADGYSGWTYRIKITWMSTIHARLGHREPCLAALDTLITGWQARTGDSRTPYHWQRVLRLAELGDIARAESELETLKQQVVTDSASLDDYYRIRGELCLIVDEGTIALESFRKTEKDRSDFEDRYLRARALLSSGNIRDAIPAFEKAESFYTGNRVFSPLHSVDVHFYAARAYEEAGRTDDAVARYEKFIEIWKDADPELILVAEAKRRLASLR